MAREKVHDGTYISFAGVQKALKLEFVLMSSKITKYNNFGSVI